MRSVNKHGVRTMAVVALIGAFGAAGASVAAADVVVDLDPNTEPSGAHCMVVDDRGDWSFLYTEFKCNTKQSRIDAEQRSEDRREDRRDDRRAAEAAQKADAEQRRDERRDERRTAQAKRLADVHDVPVIERGNKLLTSATGSSTWTN